MAERIDKIERLPEGFDDEQTRAEWVDKIGKHGDALDDTLRLVQALHDRGVLSLLVGMVEQSDRIARVAAKELAQPRNVQVLENLLTLYELVGRLDPESLKEKPQPPLQRQRKMGLLGLWRQIRDPDVQRGLHWILDCLRGLGRALGKPPPDQDALE